jgi:RpiR family transcriptional regulator, carbohydrate utilization regulator
MSAVAVPGVLARLRAHLADMNDAERKVAEYVLEQPGIVHRFSVARLADESGASTGSVMRLCQRLGFTGYAAFRMALAVELLTPGYAPEARIDSIDTPWTAMSKTLRSGMTMLRDTLDLLDEQAVDRAAHALASATRVELYGTGAIASALCHLAQQRLLRLGLTSAAYTDREALTYSASLLKPGCVAVGISHYGITFEIPAAMEIARENGATTIAITSAPRSRLAEVADVVLLTGADDVPLSDAVGSRVPALAVIDGLYAAIAVLRDQEAKGPQNGAR